MSQPRIVDAQADAELRDLLREHYPDTYAWEERYVEHELGHIAHLLVPSICNVDDIPVLELGCNIGATAIVLAHHGARVTALDIDPNALRLAALNSRRYGVADVILFQLHTAGERLPFQAGCFGVVVCNSVLEYVIPAQLPPLLTEVDRVLTPGGRLLVFGTSNRLWPREVHTRRWLINYLPEVADRWLGPPIRRGVWPWQITRAFSSYRDILAGGASVDFLKAKRVMGLAGWKLAGLRGLTALAHVFGFSPGLFAPSITAVLEKPR